MTAGCGLRWLGREEIFGIRDGDGADIIERLFHIHDKRLYRSVAERVRSAFFNLLMARDFWG